VENDMDETERMLEGPQHFPGEDPFWERAFWTALPGAAAAVAVRGDPPQKAGALAAEMAAGVALVRQQRHRARQVARRRALADATAKVLREREYTVATGGSPTRVTVDRVDGEKCHFTDGTRADVLDVAAGEGFTPVAPDPPAQRRKPAKRCPGCGWPVDCETRTVTCRLGRDCQCGTTATPGHEAGRGAKILRDAATKAVTVALRPQGAGSDEVEIGCGDLRITVPLGEGVNVEQLHDVLTSLVSAALSQFVARTTQRELHVREIMGAVASRGPIASGDLETAVQDALGEAFDGALYEDVMDELCDLGELVGEEAALGATYDLGPRTGGER